MIPLILILALAFNLPSASLMVQSCRRNGNVYPELDAALAIRSEIRKSYETRVDSLKNLIPQASMAEKANLADSLRVMYERSFPDSAFLYAGKAYEYRKTLACQDTLLIASKLNYLRNSPVLNVLTSLDEFLAIDNRIIEQLGLEKEYLSCGVTLTYAAKRTLDDRKSEFERLYYDYLERYFQIDTVSSDYVVFKAREIRDGHRYGEVVDFLLPYCLENRFKREEMSVLTAYLAYVYRYLGSSYEAEKWYEKSVINDVLSAKHQNMSLAQLARSLSNRGYRKLALEYVTIASEDAELYDDIGRMALISPILSTISESVLRSERLLREIGMVSSIVISILLIIVAISFRRVKSSSRELSEMNKKIKRINKDLADANILKDTYMARYMIKCTGYIKTIDNRTSEIRRILKNDGWEALTKELHKPKYSDSELKSFYAEFDSTFLRLFPGFLEEINKRVVEGEPWRLGKGGAMPMEIRIIAAIRIGISDNEEISAFLNFPPLSIYTYRYRLKKSFGLEKMSLSEFVSTLEI